MIDNLKARASGYMHFYRKIGGGRAYQEATVDHVPRPDEGYVHYRTDCLYTAKDIHDFVVELQELAMLEDLGEEAGAYGPPCETCNGAGVIGTPGAPCFACKGKQYTGKPDTHSTFLTRLMKMVDEHGAQRWETGFEEASPIATEKGKDADKKAVHIRRRIELLVRAYIVEGLFK